MKIIGRSLLVLTLCLLQSIGVNANERAALEKPSLEKPLVVASIQPLALIVQDIAGDMVEIATLVTNSASPHDFSLTIGQAMLLRDAEVLVWVGPDFEMFLASAPRPSREIAMMADLHSPDSDSPEEKHHHTAAHHDEDLHLWLKPAAVEALAERFASELKILLPQSHSRIDSALEQFVQTHRQRQAATAEQLQPLQTRPFIVYHDGYGPFVTHYNLQQKLALTMVPHERISAKRLNQVHKESRDALCLIAELGELEEAKRYANLLDVRLQAVDVLAAQKDLVSFDMYEKKLGEAFEACLSGN